jgi:hypothetical protein
MGVVSELRVKGFGAFLASERFSVVHLLPAILQVYDWLFHSSLLGRFSAVWTLSANRSLLRDEWAWAWARPGAWAWVSVWVFARSAGAVSRVVHKSGSGHMRRTVSRIPSASQLFFLLATSNVNLDRLAYGSMSFLEGLSILELVSAGLSPKRISPIPLLPPFQVEPPPPSPSAPNHSHAHPLTPYSTHPTPPPIGTNTPHSPHSVPST